MTTLQLTKLVHAAQSGDREAFALLVEYYQALVSATTLNLTSDFQQSEDLAQESFLIAWQRLEKLNESEKFPAWLCGIAKNLTKNWLRNQNRKPVTQPIDIADAPSKGSHVDQLSEQDEIRLVWSRLQAIPETYREVMLMFYRHGEDISDIASALNLNEETVRQRLSRGRKLLKVEVERTVEKTLSRTRPDTAFTLAVLAAIPLAASAGCSATSKSIGLFAGGTAAMNGWTLLLAILTSLVFLLFHSTATILRAATTFYALWFSVKNSPTLRTRRFVLSAALDFNLFLWAYYFIRITVLHCIVLGHWGPRINLTAWYGIIPEEAVAFLFDGLPVFLLFSAFLLWAVLRWRNLLYEDLGGKIEATKNKSNEEEPAMWSGVFRSEIDFFCRLKNRLRNLQDSVLTFEGIRKKLNVCRWIVSFCLLAYIAWNSWQNYKMFSVIPTGHFSATTMFWFLGSICWTYLLQIAMQIGFFWIVAKGIRISKNEETLKTTSPQYDTAQWNLDQIGQTSQRQILQNALFFLAAIPFASMLLSVGLGIVRRINWIAPPSGNLNSYFSLPNGPYLYQIVLVVFAVLCISYVPKQRYRITAFLFLFSGFLTFFCVEWTPLLHSSVLSPLYEYLFWWIPKEEVGDFDTGRYSGMYFFWHVYSVFWLAYCLTASAVCFFLGRSLNHQTPVSETVSKE